MFAIAMLAGMQAAPPPPLVVFVVASNGQCHTMIDGQNVTSETLLARAQSEMREGREARVVAGMSVSYRCIGGAIFTLQRAGFAKVIFVSEPERRNAQ